MPPDLPSVQAFFGFTTWPQEVVRLDLGGRVLEVTGCPGHHPASIAVLDPWSGFLLTGDTVYPGRLYVDDMPSYVASLDRLVDLARSRRVTAVMGCHIEMSRTPGRDYPIGSTWQPDEAPLPMSVEQLERVRDAARAVADRPGAHVFDDVVIFNGPCRARAGHGSTCDGGRTDLRRRCTMGLKRHAAGQGAGAHSSTSRCTVRQLRVVTTWSSCLHHAGGTFVASDAVRTPLVDRPVPRRPAPRAPARPHPTRRHQRRVERPGQERHEPPGGVGA